jgi:ligand-binding sensor domain-containing protein
MDWDFVSVAVNPNDLQEFAFSGFNEGGIKVVKDGATISEVWNSTNSPIEALASGSMVVSDLRYDDAGNLWALNQGNEPLKCFAADGSQYSFSMGSSAKSKYPYRLMIDRDGYKWGAFTNAGLSVYDDGGTPDDPSDDQVQTLTASEGYGNLPSSMVKAIAQDIDGEIWIGTEEGLVVLYSTAELFTGGYGDYDAAAILIEIDGEVEKLLGQTYITAIAVDGGNRKWIGTSSSGVFCLSPDGLTEIYRFTTDNSPLISNNVLDIKIDHATGEVYFATDKGLVSFRADATIHDSDFENVKVFPNPVRPGFEGPITIQGLGYESDVKITDISGNLVYQTISNGGSAIWNGKTLQGERVASGVYLVWSGVSDGKGRKVAKILFIN